MIVIIKFSEKCHCLSFPARSGHVHVARGVVAVGDVDVGQVIVVVIVVIVVVVIIVVDVVHHAVMRWEKQVSNTAL